MAKREQKNELKVYLSDDENYIPEQKVKAAKKRDKSSFIRHLILYGFVFDIDYSYLREYNTNLARINNNLNQIANCTKYNCELNATGNVYAADVKQVKELMEQVWESQKAMCKKQPVQKL